jgi:hypothetical protein
MDSDYDNALAFVLRWEGGFANNPYDSGGRTMKGVTQRVYEDPATGGRRHVGQRLWADDTTSLRGVQRAGRCRALLFNSRGALPPLC